MVVDLKVSYSGSLVKINEHVRISKPVDGNGILIINSHNSRIVTLDIRKTPSHGVLPTQVLGVSMCWILTVEKIPAADVRK